MPRERTSSQGHQRTLPSSTAYVRRTREGKDQEPVQKRRHRTVLRQSFGLVSTPLRLRSLIPGGFSLKGSRSLPHLLLALLGRLSGRAHSILSRSDQLDICLSSTNKTFNFNGKVEQAGYSIAIVSPSDWDLLCGPHRFCVCRRRIEGI